jgi:fucose permease
MVLGMIVSSLISARSVTHKGLRPVYIGGMLFAAASLVLFAATSLLYHAKEQAHFILNISLLLLGIGYGAILTPLNTYIARYFPWRISSAMTALYMCLGTGCALAPLLLTAALSAHLWWLDPLLLALLFVGLAAATHYILPAADPPTIVLEMDKGEPKKIFKVPFKRFVAIAFLYGICETVFGNFTAIYLHGPKNFSLQTAATGLSLFWAMITIGRAFIAWLSLRVDPTKILCVLPWFIAASFILIPFTQGVISSMSVIAIAGLGCSGCFPLNLSFAEKDFPKFASLVSGTLISAYVFGLGAATYGVGVLNTCHHYSLDSIFSGSAIIALTLALVVVRHTHN